MSSNPIVEAKVKTSSAAAAVTGLILSALATYVFGGEVPGAVEQIVTQVVGTVVPAAVTYAAGWVTRHTPRVDIEATRQRELRGLKP